MAAAVLSKMIELKINETPKLVDLPLPPFALDIMQKNDLWPVSHVQDEERTRRVLTDSPESPVPGRLLQVIHQPNRSVA